MRQFLRMGPPFTKKLLFHYATNLEGAATVEYCSALSLKMTDNIGGSQEPSLAIGTRGTYSIRVRSYEVGQLSSRRRLIQTSVKPICEPMLLDTFASHRLVPFSI